MSKYNFKEVEENILKFWDENEIYKKVKKYLEDKPIFSFIDGPPYASGRIHIGHAWNKSLKDAFLRFKRMRGYRVWDQPGYDTHGLPIEVKVEKKFGIKNKKEIVEKYGVKKFIEMCKEFADEHIKYMNEDFKRLGVWMDWENPYYTYKNEYIEGAWWALKKAWENGYLYKGKKVLHWCPRCETALAKHELEYKTIKENSIYVKFPIKGRKNEYLLVWTTTPWTLPMNLAVMANPDFDYVKIKVGEEYWILAKGLVNALLGAMGKDFEIVEEFKGKDLEGLEYEPLFDIKTPEGKWVRKVILSEEFVTLEAGTGLVHTAPGCGPEDYLVGKKYGLEPFNIVNEKGEFDERAGKFKGLVAKKDDTKIVEYLREKGYLAWEAEIEHEYPHCWRCKTPLIFRATDQWFLAVSQLKEEMLKENKKVKWIPPSVKDWFGNWLKGLEDWCISRQRFWGIPLPIWVCKKCGKFKVIGSKKELEELSGQKIEDLHKPWVDEIKLKCECGGEMERVGDVLDVWLDSGAAPWASLDFPSKNKELFEEMFPIEFILEGKDQIRGWFNSLMCLSMVSLKKAPYKTVFMHGFTVDEFGRKMSKSLGNMVTPQEVIEKFGADAYRLFVSNVEAGVDIPYNEKVIADKLKELNIIWNMHEFIIKYAKYLGINPKEFGEVKRIEDKWILSKLNKTIKEVTEYLEDYKIWKAVRLLEEFLIEDISRFYIKIIRDRLVDGDQTALKVLFKVYLEAIKMLGIITPFIGEAIYQNLRKEFDLDKESLFMWNWPEYGEINEDLIKKMEIVEKIVEIILERRETKKRNIRWPIRYLFVEKKLDKELEDIIGNLVNALKVESGELFEKAKMKFKIKYEKLEEIFGNKAPSVMAKLLEISPKNLMKKLEEGFEIDGKKITKEIFKFEYELPENFEVVEWDTNVYIDWNEDEEVIGKGFTRETIRRIQELRKKEGLERTDSVVVGIVCDKEIKEYLNKNFDEIVKKVGAKDLIISEEDISKEFKRCLEFKVRNKKITVCITPV